jgi:hypothetical protein
LYFPARIDFHHHLPDSLFILVLSRLLGREHKWGFTEEIGNTDFYVDLIVNVPKYSMENQASKFLPSTVSFDFPSI